MEEKKEVSMEISKEEEMKKELLEKSEVSLWLEDYEDIFSDFDPRPYSERELSDDFLRETKKVVREKKGGAFELKLLIPGAKRSPGKEAVIKRRLKEYFRKNFLVHKKEVKNIKMRGGILALIGFVLLILAAYIAYYQSTNFALSFLLVLFEPAGWFSMWFGLDEIFYKVREKRPELEFFKKMSRVDISFISY